MATGIKRTKLQVSLRWLLIAFALLQIPFAYIYYLRSRMTGEQSALSQLHSDRGTTHRGALPRTNDGVMDVSRTRAAQQFFADWGLEEELYSVTHLVCRERNLDHRLEGLLSELPHLKELRFSVCTFTPDARLPPTQLRELESLSFSGTIIHDGMLASIASQPALKELSLHSCSLPNSLAPLGDMKHLDKISFVGSQQMQITDWSFLLMLQNLKFLQIHGQSDVGAIIECLPPSVDRFRAIACHLDKMPQLAPDREFGLEEIELSLFESEPPSTEVVETFCRVLLDRSPKMKVTRLSNTNPIMQKRLKLAYPKVNFRFL